ncbi:MAG: AMP-binding protein [Proteobacteria bacterium]|nr:AMP-binding protein [Pseudomonadota bacterium]
MTQDEKFIFKKIIKEGTIIKSSGTSGIAKDIFQSPVKLKAADKIAIECQGITPNSKIYTVCNLNHAGGLLAQTLPGFRIGADVTVEKFNAYKFCRVIQNYTHTHITPAHGEAIIQTKSFKNLNLSNLTITCGSDRVKWNLIEKFVERRATFICNWGMSEIGPIVINTVFIGLSIVIIYPYH